MCDFCDNIRAKILLEYDNRDSMNISYDQHSGVNVHANLNMKGNMLILHAGGSYRSRSDCYYESWDIECDNEYARPSSDVYIQIEYCPFCGKKIKSNLYEQESTKDEIKELKKSLKALEEDRKYANMFIRFSWVLRDNQDFVNCYETSHTIKELAEKFDNLKSSIQYGEDDEEDRWGEFPKTLSLDTKIQSGSFFRPTFYGAAYFLPDEVYEQLSELGYIKPNDKKLKTLKNKQKKIEKKIQETKEKIKKLEEYYKTLV